KEAQLAGGWKGDCNLHGASRRKIFVNSQGWEAKIVERPGLVLDLQFHGLSRLATQERRLEVIVVGLQVHLSFSAHILRAVVRGRNVARWTPRSAGLGPHRRAGGTSR